MRLRGSAQWVEIRHHVSADAIQPHGFADALLDHAGCPEPVGGDLKEAPSKTCVLIEKGLDGRTELEQMKVFLSEDICRAGLRGRECHPANDLTWPQVGHPLTTALDRGHALVHEVDAVPHVTATQRYSPFTTVHDSVRLEMNDSSSSVKLAKKLQTLENGDVASVWGVGIKADRGLRMCCRTRRCDRLRGGPSATEDALGPVFDGPIPCSRSGS